MMFVWLFVFDIVILWRTVSCTTLAQYCGMSSKTNSRIFHQTISHTSLKTFIKTRQLFLFRDAFKPAHFPSAEICCVHCNVCFSSNDWESILN